MRLKLITVPNKQLRQKSSPFDTFTSKDEQFLANLAETLLQKDDPPGVGLSAVQVGELKRVFVTYLPPLFDLGQNAKNTPKPELKFFINPEIIDHSGQTTLGDDPKTPALEGCLSVPALYGPVSRYQTVKVKYQTLGDAEVKKFMHAAGPHEVGASTLNFDLESLVEKVDIFSNFYARVIQHEYDHLEGILFTDHIKTDNHGLYFDQGNQLVEVTNPDELIQW